MQTLLSRLKRSVTFVCYRCRRCSVRVQRFPLWLRGNSTTLQYGPRRSPSQTVPPSPSTSLQVSARIQNADQSFYFLLTTWVFVYLAAPSAVTMWLANKTTSSIRVQWSVVRGVSSKLLLSIKNRTFSQELIIRHREGRSVSPNKNNRAQSQCHVDYSKFVRAKTMTAAAVRSQIT